jgi:hypothetical protein
MLFKHMIKFEVVAVEVTIESMLRGHA